MIKKPTCLILLLFFLAALSVGSAGANAGAFRYARIDLTDPQDLATLYELNVTITSRSENQIQVFVSDQEFQALEAMGFAIESLPSPADENVKAYPAYAAIAEELEATAAANPDVTHLFSLGRTASERELLVLKISDQADISEPEPAFLLEFNIHGDEKIAAEVALCLIRELMDSYPNDPGTRRIIEENELFIVPVLNPDGYATNRRTNARGIDLNRNFGWWWEGTGFSPASEIEVQQIMQLAFDENFLFGISFHAGAELVNYPFDSTPMRAPDDADYQFLSSVYGDTAGYPITNGYDWYRASGISEESYYGSNGTLAVIVEISTMKSPPASQVPSYCARNVSAIRQWIDAGASRVHGTITDALTGQPVPARIYPLHGGWPVWSDPLSGDFHRFAQPGVVSLRIEANGYETHLEENVLVQADGSPPVDIKLERSTERSTHAAYKVCAVRTPRPFLSYANETLPIRTLGEKDNDAFSLGADGWIVLDMGPDTPIRRIDGYDFIVHENEADGAQAFSVQGGQNWQGPFRTIGDGLGTTAFDLPDDMTTVRYLRIKDTSGQDPRGAAPGADIDAVEQRLECPAPTGDFSASPTFGPAPLTVDLTAVTAGEPECLAGVSWKFGDGNTGQGLATRHTYMAPGTYTVTMTVLGAGGQTTKVKDGLIVVDSNDPDDDNDDVDDDDSDDEATDACCG